MKNWLVERFLPMWAKETVLSDNRRLIDENLRLRQKNSQLQAYIDGVHTGIRTAKRITIHNGGSTQ